MVSAYPKRINIEGNLSAQMYVKMAVKRHVSVHKAQPVLNQIRWYINVVRQNYNDCMKMHRLRTKLKRRQKTIQNIAIRYRYNK